MHTPGRYHTQWQLSRKKGFFLTAALLIFGAVILGLSVWQQMERQVEDSIVDKAILSLVPTPSVVGSGWARQPVQPGTMPDQIGYPFQAAKDRLLILFTKEPVARAALFKELADRRLSMIPYLLNRGKPDLAAETLLKAEGYLLKAQELLDECEQTTEVTQEWYALLETVQAHKLALQELRLIMPQPVMPTVEKAWEQLLLVEARTRAGCERGKTELDQ